MRLAPTTALQYASSTATTASNASLPWLQNLKLAQLQRIAQATGIQSSGPKGPLIRRLEREMAQCEAPRVDGRADRGPMSILSIDMGIRNLAFAHLVVPFASSHSSPMSGSSSASNDGVRGMGMTPRLNAWRRLAISDLRPLPLPLSGEDIKPESTHGRIPSGSQPDQAGGAQAQAQEKEKEKEDFSPARYAPLAYGLITSLLDRYRPTHVLIERQRFRTGGGSAVQEWTLRVGVFEGMLYAVLFALRERERGGLGHQIYSDQELKQRGQWGEGSGDGMAPVVVGVEPQRVVRYWGNLVPRSSLGGESEGKGKRKKRASMTAREGKKVKIDLVGGWLDRGIAASSIPPSGGDVPLLRSGCDRVMVGEDPEVRRWVEGYLARWKGKGKGRNKSKPRTTDIEVEIGKLDDLADCLLQGVTWLEWQVMRERLMREGMDALEM